MEINYIKYLKHSLTVSYKGSGTYSGLEDIHTVKDTNDYSVLWGSPDTTSSHWLKLNVYRIMPLSQITIPYTGTFDDIDVYTSIDNLNWELVTTYTYDVEDDGEIDMTTSNFQYYDFVFLKLVVNNPTTFRMKDLFVYGEVEYTNDNFISHFNYNFYGSSYRDTYPFLPEMAELSLKAIEGYESIDDTLFNPSDYDSATITIVNQVDDVFSLSATGFPVDSGVIYYIWNFDDPQDEYLDDERTLVNPAYDENNPNIVITSDLNTMPEHDYSNSADGIYVPSLTVKKKKYMLEFTEYFVKS